MFTTTAFALFATLAQVPAPQQPQQQPKPVYELSLRESAVVRGLDVLVSDVVDVGPGVTHLTTGDRVATSTPHSSVFVETSNSTPQSHPCGTCGVYIHFSRRLPIENSSPSPNPRAGRDAKSFSDVSTPISVPNPVACGATASNSFNAPNSSPSKCDPPIHFRFSTGITAFTAPTVIGNSFRYPVWNSTGSSSSIK